jgi:hypothetical protein
MDTEALGRIAAAHLEAADALHRLVEAINSGEATARPSEAEPAPAPSRWITDRVPEIDNTDREGNVQVPPRDGGHYVCIVHYLGVYPGTPWAPVNATPDGPWDPTTLDRNGWIRSRLPTKNDTSLTNMVQIPVGHGGTTSTIAYDLIIPGQPWAPWNSTPGRFEK